MINVRTILCAVLLLVAGPALANTCELEITGNDQIQYNKSTLTVPADCDEVTLTLEHVGQLAVQQMGHNWVLAKTGDWKTLAQSGQAGGLENNYLPAGDSRVIAATDMIGGGESTSVTFDVSGLEAGGDYTFFCSFPGHSAIMNGKLVIE